MAYLTLDEVSERFGFNRQVWRRWVAAGKVPAHIEGRAWVIEESVAKAYSESRKAPEARRNLASLSFRVRQELQRSPDSSNIEIARMVGVNPSVVSEERRKLGLPPLPHGGRSKAPPGWQPVRKRKA